jgi:hypothetical protein
MNRSSNVHLSFRARRNAIILLTIVSSAMPGAIFADEGGAPRGVSCPGSGDCFVANFTPGCDDAACCQSVCGFDPFCCNNQWDGQCATEAAVACAGCGGADGDVNDDGSVDGRDVQAFVSATIGAPTPDEICRGDFSGNGNLGVEDVAPMVAALLAP